MRDLEKEIETMFSENLSIIQHNAEMYGYDLENVCNIRNYIDLASLMNMDNNTFKDTDIEFWAEMIQGYINDFIFEK